MIRQRDAIDGSLKDPRMATEHLGHLGRGHVLALPAEGVSEAVEEEPAAVGIAAQRVARPVPQVALAEDVADVLLVGGVGVLVVAGEGGRDARGLGDEDLAAGLVGDAAREARGGVAGDVARLDVDLDGDVDVAEAAAHDEAVVADGVGAEVAPRRVVQRHDALGRVEELEDRLDAEPVAERLPHVRPQPVAVDRVHAVLPVARRRRRRQQVPQRLAHVDEPRGPRGADVVPEPGRAELGRDAQRLPRQQLRHGADPARPVVQRHAVVVALALALDVAEAAVAAAAVHEPGHGGHDDGFGHARRPARVEEAEGRVRADARAQLVAGPLAARRVDLLGAGLGELDDAHALGAQLVPDGLQPFKEAVGALGEDQLRVRDVEAVQQRLPGQVVVDEGGRRADGPQPHPRQHELGAVSHEEGDEVPGLYAVAQEPLRVLIRAVVRLGPGVGPRPRPDAFLIRQRLRVLLEEIVGREPTFFHYFIFIIVSLSEHKIPFSPPAFPSSPEQSEYRRPDISRCNLRAFLKSFSPLPLALRACISCLKWYFPSRYVRPATVARAEAAVVLQDQISTC